MLENFIYGNPKYNLNVTTEVDLIQDMKDMQLPDFNLSMKSAQAISQGTSQLYEQDRDFAEKILCGRKIVTEKGYILDGYSSRLPTINAILDMEKNLRGLKILESELHGKKQDVELHEYPCMDDMEDKLCSHTVKSERGLIYIHEIRSKFQRKSSSERMKENGFIDRMKDFFCY